MVRAGGSDSRTIGDQNTTDPGGGVCDSRRRQPAWQLPLGCGLRPHWASNAQAFPPFGSYSTTDHGQNRWKLPDRTEGVLGSGNPMVLISPTEMDRDSWSVDPHVSGASRHMRGMRPAGGIRPIPQRANNELVDWGGGN